MGGPDIGPRALEFTYTPLSRPHDIRLVELIPAPRQEDEICCRMLHSSLAEEPSACTISYEALSYTWDSPPLTAQIICDGYQIDITPNLHAALRSLRNTGRSRILWVDQICISQQDLAERSAQVRIMHSVYQQAVQAIVWLGGADATSSTAMDFLVSLNEKFASWESRKPGRVISFADLGKHGLLRRQIFGGLILGLCWRGHGFIGYGYCRR